MRLMYCSALDIMLTIGRLLDTLTIVDMKKLGFFTIPTKFVRTHLKRLIDILEEAYLSLGNCREAGPGAER